MRRVAVLTAIVVMLSGPAFAQDNATVQRLADQFAEAFNNNAATGIGELYSEEAILVPPGADIRMGRKDIQAFWVQQAKLAEALSIAVLDVKSLGPLLVKQPVLDLHPADPLQGAARLIVSISSAHTLRHSGSRPLTSTLVAPDPCTPQRQR
jgi:hypothetical protein